MLNWSDFGHLRGDNGSNARSGSISFLTQFQRKALFGGVGNSNISKSQTFGPQHSRVHYLFHFWSLSCGSSLVRTVKQYKKLFQPQISTEIVFPCFYTIYTDELNTWPTILGDGQTNLVKITLEWDKAFEESNSSRRSHVKVLSSCFKEVKTQSKVSPMECWFFGFVISALSSWWDCREIWLLERFEV